MRARRGWLDSGVGASRRAWTAFGLATVLLTAAPAALLSASPAWGDGGGTLSCTGTSPDGPVSELITMDAGTSGIAYLGSPSNAPGEGSPYIGSCTLDGTIPSGWTVDSAVNLGVTDGSGNAGVLELSSDDHTITGNGTFTNSGSIDDVSPGFTQQLNVEHVVNTGSLSASQPAGASEGPDFEIGGADATAVFDNQGTVSAGTGATIAVVNGTFRLDDGATVAASPGTFTLEHYSTLDVEGGTVSSGAISTTVILGVGPSTIEFGSSVSPTSTGAIQLDSPIALSGTVPTNWSLAIDGGSVTAAPGAGNAGTVTWNTGNSTLSDTGTFTNSGSIDDVSAGNVQNISVADFVNTGTVRSDGPGLELAGSSSANDFENQGAVVVGSGDTITVSDGTFTLESGGTVAAAGGTFQLAHHSTFDVQAGSVTSGVVSTLTSLGVGPSNLTFESGVPSMSTGTVVDSSSITLNGTIPAGWSVDVTGGTFTGALGAANDGTLTFDGGQTFTGTGAFTNAGSLVVDQFLNVSLASFTNATGGTFDDVAGNVNFSQPPTNLVAGVLTGGTWIAGARVLLTAPVTTDDSDVTVSGSGVFASHVNLSFVTDALSGLQAIGSSGALRLANGAAETVSSTLVNAGTVALDHATTLSIGGAYTQSSSGELDSTLHGTNPGHDFGRVVATGHVALDGTAQVTLAAGYAPAPSDTQTIVTGSTVSGTFAALTGATSTPNGNVVVSYTPSAATLGIDSLGLVLSSPTSDYGAAGDSIALHYSVTNNTEVTVSNVSVEDTLVLSASIACPSSSLAAGASETCTSSYTVSQADVDAGSVVDTASASATTPTNVTVASPSSTVEVPASRAASSLTSSASTTTSSYRAPADPITLDDLVTNTGTTTLSRVAIDDSLVPGASFDCPSPSLAPGASETCTGTYTATQDDVNTGSVTDTSQATATAPDSHTVASSPSSLTIDAAVVAHVSFEKTSTSPEVVVTGSGFGTAPSAVAACSAGNTDYAGGLLWIEDTNTLAAAGEPGDCIGLKIGTYTNNEVTFTFGSQYRHYAPLANGHQFELHINGAVFTGTAAYAAPVVLKVSPVSGAAGGGRRVRLSGLGLMAASAVMFGSRAASAFTVNTTGTSITATAPAGTRAGVVDITVTTPIGTSAPWVGDEFSYLPPVITAVSPATGPGGGGTTVHIRGTALTAASAVMFGPRAASSFTVNAGGTMITAVSPPGTGTVDIRVTTAGGTSAIVAADRFTYS